MHCYTQDASIHPSIHVSYLLCITPSVPPSASLFLSGPSSTGGAASAGPAAWPIVSRSAFLPCLAAGTPVGCWGLSAFSPSPSPSLSCPSCSSSSSNTSRILLTPLNCPLAWSCRCVVDVMSSFTHTLGLWPASTCCRKLCGRNIGLERSSLSAHSYIDRSRLVYRFSILSSLLAFLSRSVLQSSSTMLISDNTRTASCRSGTSTLMGVAGGDGTAAAAAPAPAAVDADAAAAKAAASPLARISAAI
mmetsp:Transcript_18662/g.44917  ORF Transcript_18662/g.44917 Transcript_18662/m.44917 type:complete len:247 (+) Transcript_18662:120-860(+)